jgi:hypothetical protein
MITKNQSKHLREAEARVAQIYDRDRQQNVHAALMAVLKLIEELDPTGPSIIDCSSITGISQPVLVAALPKLTKFAFKPVDDAYFSFIVHRK